MPTPRRRPPRARSGWPGGRRAGRRSPSPRRWGCLRLAGWCGSRSCGRALALGGFQGRWKGEVESGALAGFGFCPDAAVMARDDTLDAGQADAGAGELGRCMQALEHAERSEEHTSELQSLMRISYAVFCLKKKKKQTHQTQTTKPTDHHQKQR